MSQKPSEQLGSKAQRYIKALEERGYRRGEPQEGVVLDLLYWALESNEEQAQKLVESSQGLMILLGHMKMPKK